MVGIEHVDVMDAVHLNRSLLAICNFLQVSGCDVTMGYDMEAVCVAVEHREMYIWRHIESHHLHLIPILPYLFTHTQT